MLGMPQPQLPVPPQPPAASAISATPTPAPSNVATQAASLATPAIPAQAPPRTAAMPDGNSIPPAAKPKPLTNTSKAVKPTNYKPSSTT